MRQGCLAINRTHKQNLFITQQPIAPALLNYYLKSLFRGSLFHNITKRARLKGSLPAIRRPPGAQLPYEMDPFRTQEPVLRLIPRTPTFYIFIPPLSTQKNIFQMNIFPNNLYTIDNERIKNLEPTQFLTPR